VSINERKRRLLVSATHMLIPKICFCCKFIKK